MNQFSKIRGHVSTTDFEGKYFKNDHFCVKTQQLMIDNMQLT